MAMGEYAVTFPCEGCGKELLVCVDAEREDLTRYMQDEGWGHPECL